MDEYIKREDALDALMFELAGSGYQSRARDVIRLLPTADVAPRAEVAREIFEEIDKRFEALLGFYPCNGEFEDAKGFVDFHWKYIKRSIMRDYDPDFEKKYTATTDELPKGE